MFPMRTPNKVTLGLRIGFIPDVYRLYLYPQKHGFKRGGTLKMTQNFSSDSLCASLFMEAIVFFPFQTAYILFQITTRSSSQTAGVFAWTIDRK